MEEQEQYERVCKPAFDRINTDVAAVLAIVNRLDIAFFKGNGTPGFATRLDRVERDNAARKDNSTWLMRTIIVANITALVVAFWAKFGG